MCLLGLLYSEYCCVMLDGVVMLIWVFGLYVLNGWLLMCEIWK